MSSLLFKINLIILFDFKLTIRLVKMTLSLNNVSVQLASK